MDSWLLPLLQGPWALLALFGSAFLSATILPGNSELALATLVHWVPAQLWPGVAVATFGNTLGSLTSYWLGGRLAAHPDGRATVWLRRWGSPVLLLSWLPLIGDGFCLAAGWARLPIIHCAAYIFVGKLLRYLLIVAPFFYLGAI
ncbi:YqaA family protein [Chitinimonas lacunae]|uniref:YqaA family protein n=1 Tax=Chitinimonas lacunae TaxID=1963018 RepID=A0ABV8MSB3_9NEIS